ncbi:polysaccharide deacetylase family protein [Flavobacteriaceae bacterium TP-CH-4]|uniref:Polysaccharide deacetylase family protein n=1 Tax=Pelagihabitans pacificus TaxID=2696054 RepID=A0A967AYF7_9FLAO|nr:polysaccharide deacetylase family protein [Pelagihabitans pacificus]NHF59892.1 polysaccharide deacetylase family protein [Pelagihabitans pacificus]
MNYLRIFALCIVFITTTGHSQGASSNIIWPNGAKAAICLTYDDAMVTQLEHALPSLDSVGLKGTFFLNPTRSRSEILGWMDAARNGHELGNHSVLHPCPAALGWDARVTTENYTVEQMLNEVRLMNDFLQTLDSARVERTYAYPCSNLEVGGGSYVRALKESKLVRYARKGGNSESIIFDFGKLNFYEVPSYEVQKATSGKALIRYVERTKELNGLGVFMFHGINGQWFNVLKKDHDELLAYLKKNIDTFWVTTFSEAMQYVEEQRNQ